MNEIIFDVVRVLLGGIFFIFGLNGFFNWFPLPPMNPAMTRFNEHMQGTKIIMPVVKVFEVVFGLCLILDWMTFFATLALLPICFFIVLAHLALNRPKGLTMAGIFTVLPGILLWQQQEQFFVFLQIATP